MGFGVLSNCCALNDPTYPGECTSSGCPDNNLAKDDSNANYCHGNLGACSSLTLSCNLITPQGGSVCSYDSVYNAIIGTGTHCWGTTICNPNVNGGVCNGDGVNYPLYAVCYGDGSSGNWKICNPATYTLFRYDTLQRA